MMNHKIYGSYVFWSLNRFKSLQWLLAAFGGGLYRLEHCALTHKNLRSLSLRPPFVTLRLKEEEQGRSLEYLSIFVSMQCSQLWLIFRKIGFSWIWGYKKWQIIPKEIYAFSKHPINYKKSWEHWLIQLSNKEFLLLCFN